MAPRDDDDFAYLAHDLSQVLWAIQGRARALALDLSPAAAGEVSVLAEYAAAAAGMLDREAAGPADLQAVIAAAWRQALDRASALAAPIARCRLRVAGEAPPVAIPASALRRILGNLFANALATRPGDVTVECRLAVADQQVELAVADDGPGIPAALQGRLFRPGATSSGKAGRGLGLAGAQALARRWGGDLDSTGRTGGGACFRLVLPVAGEAPAGRVAGEVPTIGPAAEETPASTVLVVDDDPAVREMLQQLLAAMGHRPTLAGDHDEALRLGAGRAFAAALVDLGLPGRSGRELAARLRERDPALAIVLLTGWGREQELADLPDRFVDLTALKPLDLPQLRQLLAQAVRLTASRRAGRAPES